MLRFKPEVRIGFFPDQLAAMLQIAADWSLEQRIDVIVNSIEDDAPGRVPGSLHAYGLAVDVEPAGNTVTVRGLLAAYFRVMLPPGYDVVFESSHVHVEYDAHRPKLVEVPG